MSQIQTDRMVTGRARTSSNALTSADTAVTVPVDVAARPCSCSRPAGGLAGGQPGPEPALVPPVSYRGRPFDVDNTTGGTSWLVLVAAGGMVTAVLGVIAGFGPPGPALAAQILLLVVVALVVLAAAAAVASRRVGQRRDAR